MISNILGIHPVTPFLVIGILAIGFCFYLIFKDSSWFEKLFKKVTEEKTTIETTHVINNIGDAEEALSERAVTQRKEADKLEKNSKVIDSFLDNRTKQGDSDTKEGKSMK